MFRQVKRNFQNQLAKIKEDRKCFLHMTKVKKNKTDVTVDSIVNEYAQLIIDVQEKAGLLNDFIWSV